jgi:flagellar hook assembly protein FlgD
VELALPRAERIEARMLDVAGRVVKVLARGPVECCRHALVWDGTDEQGAPLAPGCYLLQVIHEGGVLSRKIAIVR